MEGEVFGAHTDELLDILVEEDILQKSGSRYYWMTESYPAEQVSLRTASTDNFVIIQQGPVGNQPGTPELLRDTHAQINHSSPLRQPAPVLRIEQRTTAGGQYDGWQLRQPVDRLCLALAKTAFSFFFEYETNIDAGLFLYLEIGIVKRHTQCLAEASPDRGFSGAHRANQKYTRATAFFGAWTHCHSLTGQSRIPPPGHDRIRGNFHQRPAWPALFLNQKL